MNVSIIIPTFNGWSRSLKDCLQALIGQITRKAFEIIVVDDDSADSTAAMVKAYAGVRYLHQKRLGPAAARNLGARAARGEILLFTDDDCIPRPDWLEKMVRPFEDRETVGVKGAYETSQKTLVARFVQIEYEEKYDELKKHGSIDLIDTYSAGFRRDVFLRENGFDETFPVPSVEDREFSFRLAHHGYKLVFAPDAIVSHSHPESLLSYFQKKRKNGYWATVLLKQYPHMLAGTSDTPFTQKMQLLLAPFVLGSFLSRGFSLSPKIMGRVFWGSFILFLITSSGLARRALLNSPVLFFLSPLFLFFRAIGLGFGLLEGFHQERSLVRRG